MMGPTHKLLGAATAYGAAEAAHADLIGHACLIGAAISASSLPDVDTRRLVKWLASHRPFRWLRHRRGTHRFQAATIVTAGYVWAAALLLGPLWPFVGAGAFIGYGMHLIADRLTITGLEGARVPHLLPKGLRFVTNGPGERVLALAVVVALGLYLNAAY